MRAAEPAEGLAAGRAEQEVESEAVVHDRPPNQGAAALDKAAVAAISRVP